MGGVWSSQTLMFQDCRLASRGWLERGAHRALICSIRSSQLKQHSAHTPFLYKISKTKNRGKTTTKKKKTIKRILTRTQDNSFILNFFFFFSFWMTNKHCFFFFFLPSCFYIIRRPPSWNSWWPGRRASPPGQRNVAVWILTYSGFVNVTNQPILTHG